MTNPVYTKVSAYAMLNGTKTPITSFRVGYKLNQIPVATFNVPIGANVTEDSNDNPTLSFLFDQGAWVDVEVFLGMSTNPAAEPSYKLVFEGYVIAPHSSIKRTVMGGMAYFGVNCIGKSHALISAARSTGNINAAVAGTSDNHDNAYIQGEAVAATAAGALAALSDNPLDDIWQTTYDLAYNSILQGDPYTDREIQDENAFNALDRINTGDQSKKLTLIATENDSAEHMLAAQAVNYFADTWYAGNLGGTFNGGSVWDAIDQIRQDFLLYYVPTPEADYLLPLTLGLGGAPFKTITPAEYHELIIPEADARRQVIDSVILFDETTPAANAWEREAFKIFAAAAYIDRAGKEAAQPVTYPMPDWLVPKHPSGVLAGQTLAGQIPDASNPDVEKEADETYNEGVTGIQEIAEQAAYAFLYAKAFESRTLAITGKLRLDIAPGSLVAIQIIGDRFGSGYAGLLYGHAAEVNISVTGENATTQLVITALRFPDEHAKLPTDGHPLFEAGAIPGFPLVAEEE